jgi:hypothetical protein
MLLHHPAARVLVSAEWGPAARGPAAIPAAILAVSAVSAGVSAYAAYSSSAAQKQAAQFNQGVAEQNQQVAGVQTQQAAAAGQAKEDAYRRKLAALMGDQRAELAGTGVDINTGSALELQQDTAGLGAADISTIRQDTRNSVWQARLGGTSAADQAKLYGLQADNTSPGLALGSSLLGSASSIASSWYSWNRPVPGQR